MRRPATTVTLLLDELADPNEPLDIEVEFKGAVGGTRPATRPYFGYLGPG